MANLRAKSALAPVTSSDVSPRARRTLSAFVLLLGSMGLLSCVDTQTSEANALVQRRRPSPTAGGVSTALSPAAGRATETAVQASIPVPPSTTRYVKTKVEVPPGYYLDNRLRLAHTSSCPQRPGGRPTAPSVVTMLGYEIHQECANLPQKPQYREVETLSPEWREYENKVAELEASRKAVEPVHPAQSFTASSSRSGSSASSSHGSSSGEVRVKGYTRKDGTYVPPHTRKRPKK